MSELNVKDLHRSYLEKPNAMRSDYGYIALLRVLICFWGMFLDTNLHWGILGICCSGVLPDILGLDDMLCNDKRRIHGYCSGWN